MTAIESVQLEAARIVSGAIRGTSHEAIYNELGWETLAKRRERQQLLLFQKMKYGQCPEYLNELVPQRTGTLHTYRIRNRNQLIQPRCRTEQYRQSFLPNVIKLWNTLSPEISCIDNYNTFKRKLIETKPIANRLYYEGDRLSNIAHATLRMGCSKLNDHLFNNIHVIESPVCICGIEDETVEHYFFRCPLHIRSRIDMILGILQQSDILIDDINSELLLYGSENVSYNINISIFRHVHLFIHETERFIA
jgi:hypothetical protein